MKFEKDKITLIHGDCMDYMRDIPDNYFDLAIVDPPYNDTFNYKACADNKAMKGKYNLSTLNGFKPTEQYWKELKRVSKNQIIWGANWYGIYFGAGGICWFKENTGNYSPCEYAYQSFNNHINYIKFRWNGMLQGDMKNKEHRIHPTQKPIKLYDWLLHNYAKPGQRILDTHLGSGSSAIAAHYFGCEFVGIELDEDYYKAAIDRFKNSTAQESLF